MARRVFLFVLDSFGIGAAKDAADFGDAGVNTLKRISEVTSFNIPNLLSLGLGHIDGVDYLPREGELCSSVARLAEKSLGKDTTTGHWELMGIISSSPLPTYPNGFPKEVIDRVEEVTGRGVIVNKPYSGTDVIRDFGDEHMKSGDLIVYTSADSVFQIAAHEEVVPLSELYGYCEAVREILVGEHSVGRVIARPFVGESGSYKRSEGRRDFSLKPPKKSYLDEIKARGLKVISVGKINDIFAGEGITESHPTHANAEGMEKALEFLKRDFEGLCFINLVDFDMLYGHRQDTEGYAKAIMRFDKFLPEFTRGMQNGDVLMITADHGCDPGDDSTDHTREYVPLIVYGDGIIPENRGTLEGFDNVGRLVCELLTR